MIIQFPGENILIQHKFTDIADDWSKETFPQLAYGTLRSYTAGLKNAKLYFNDKNIENITHQDINSYFTDYLVAKRNLGKNTVKNYRNVISGIFKYAVLKDIIPANPVKDVTIPKGLKTTPRPLPPDSDIEKVKANINSEFGLFYYIALFTGLRRGEILALRYEDFDFKNNLIKVDKSIYYKHNKPYVKKPKTEAGIRYTPFLEQLKSRIPKNMEGALFADEYGNYLTESQLKVKLNRYKRETKVVGTPHQIRHEFATHLYQANIPDKDISTILGHSDVSTSKNIYIHITKQQLSKSTEILNKYFS